MRSGASDRVATAGRCLSADHAGAFQVRCPCSPWHPVPFSRNEPSAPRSWPGPPARSVDICNLYAACAAVAPQGELELLSVVFGDE